MNTMNTAQYQAIAGFTLDLGLVGSAEKSQVWVLSAMKDHGPAVVHLHWRILGNEDDVCDAYQETFLRLANLNDFRKPSSVKAYLYRTASNIAITILRRKKMRCKAQSFLVGRYSEQVDPDIPAELDVKALCGKLRQALARLPEYLSDVVILHDLAEFSYQEVAKILKIRTATVRVYRHKALTLLASLLSRNDSDGVCL